MTWREQVVRKPPKELEQRIPAAFDPSRRFLPIGIETLSVIVFAALLVVMVLAAGWILVMLLRQ